MVTFQMETEMAELDARKAAAEAVLTQSHQWAQALERESADNIGGSPSLSPNPPRKTLPSTEPLTTVKRWRHSCNFSSSRYKKPLNNAERIDVRMQSRRSAWTSNA